MVKAKVKSQDTNTKHIKAVSEDFTERKKKYQELKELRQMLRERKEDHIKVEVAKRKKQEENRIRREENEIIFFKTLFIGCI